MTNKDICERARSLYAYKYWYGAKGQLASKALADTLRALNPNVWTSSYYKLALNDVDGKTKVGDCSFLVCYAYNIPLIGSYQLAEKYPRYDGNPRDGMILWRKGHVGIYDNNRQIELKGILADYQSSQYDPNLWTKVLYDPNINYSGSHEIGWHLEDTKWWYATGINDGEYYSNCIALINGAYYAFDKKGWMIQGDFKCTTDENGEIIIVQ